MSFLGRKKKFKEEINQEFVRNNTNSIKEDDILEVVSNSERIGKKMYQSRKFSQLLNEGKLMISLIKDYWKKRYTEVPWNSITAMTFSLLYVLNPLDLSPDYIPFIGFIDDATVFSFVLSMVGKDLSSYKKWKELPK